MLRQYFLARAARGHRLLDLRGARRVGERLASLVEEGRVRTDIYTDPVEATPVNQLESLRALCNDMAAALVGLDVRDLHDAPETVHETLMCLLKTHEDKSRVTREVTERLLGKVA